MRVVVGIIALFIVLPIALGGLFIATFDADSYRPKIAAAMTEKVGQEVTISGPLRLGASLSDGLVLSAHDISLANPEWASRDASVKIGKVELGVAILPLLRRRVEISSFTLSGADIRMETSLAGESNLKFPVARQKSAETAEEGNHAQTRSPVTILVDNIGVHDSRFAVRGKDGKLFAFDITSLAVALKDGKTVAQLVGAVNGLAVKVDFSGDAIERATGANWPFQASAVYDKYSLAANGSVINGGKAVTLDDYSVTAGDSGVNGKIDIALDGARPLLRGTVNSSRLDLSELKPTGIEPDADSGRKTAEGVIGNQFLFGFAPLPLSGLKVVDAKLNFNLAEVVIGLSTLKNVQAALTLADGRLLLSPLKMNVANSDAQGQIRLDASSDETRLSAIFNAPQIDLFELVRMGEVGSFVGGKGDMSLDIGSFGNSPHELASHAAGRVDVLAAGGTISGAVLGKTAAAILDMFSGGSGQPNVNCLVAKFVITNGVAHTDGVLIDTAEATILGTGEANLGAETLDMTLRARPKNIGIDGIAPRMNIGGTFMSPRVATNVTDNIKKIAGNLIENGLLGGSPADDGVPEVVANDGQNACAYALDHASGAQTGNVTGGVTIQSIVGNARDQLKANGGRLLQDLGSRFFGQ